MKDLTRVTSMLEVICSGNAKKKGLPFFASLCSLIAVLLTATIYAEEGGSGHYVPGAMASFVDGVPTQPAFVARFNGLNYDASISRPLPISGLGPLNLKATTYSAGFTFAWRPDIALPKNLSYAMSLTIPYVWLNVSGDLKLGPFKAKRSSSVNDIGDIIIVPVMLNYAVSPDLNIDFRTSIYAPTGDYKVGRLANTGKNFWTFEPTLGVRYLGQKNGIEASMFWGMDFNTQNADTDYRSGSQLHLDGTLAQHFPLFGGLAGAGVSGFWYQQVTSDSGTGARFGDFKGSTAGLGPSLSYAYKVNDADIIGEFKWLREVDATRRLEGDYFWLKVAVKF
jgi:hypothetical protein